MDDSELFDVFNIDNNPEPEQKTLAGAKTQKPKKPKKSKEQKNAAAAKEKSAAGPSNGKRGHKELSAKSDEENEVETTKLSKRHRKLEDNPIVVDSFETESEQIVPATRGLQGIAPTDHNIVIKKRVLPSSKTLVNKFSIDMQLFFQLQIGNTHLLNHFNLWTPLLVYIHSSWIPFRKCRLLLLNEMKVSL